MDKFNTLDVPARASALRQRLTSLAKLTYQRVLLLFSIVVSDSSPIYVVHRLLVFLHYSNHSTRSWARYGRCYYLAPEYNNPFDTILHWHDYPLAWINMANPLHQNWRAERSAALRDTGMTDAQFDAWLPALVLDTRVNIGNRSFMRTNHFLAAYDRAQVPDIPAFAYAATNRDDYLSELYTFCISNPAFVHQHLPTVQTNWLKRVMFNFPTDPNVILSRYAMGEPQQTAFIRIIMRVFTWQQVDAAFRDIMSRRPSGTIA